MKSIFCQSKVRLQEKSRYQIEHLQWVVTHLVTLPGEEGIFTHSRILITAFYIEFARDQDVIHNPEGNRVSFKGKGVLDHHFSRWLCQEIGAGDFPGGPAAKTVCPLQGAWV